MKSGLERVSVTFLSEEKDIILTGYALWATDKTQLAKDATLEEKIRILSMTAAMQQIRKSQI